MQCIKHSLKAKSSNSDRLIYHRLSCVLKKQLPSPQKKIKLKKRKETTSFDTSFNRYKKKKLKNENPPT